MEMSASRISRSWSVGIGWVFRYWPPSVCTVPRLRRWTSQYSPIVPPLLRRRGFLCSSERMRYPSPGYKRNASPTSAPPYPWGFRGRTCLMGASASRCKGCPADPVLWVKYFSLDSSCSITTKKTLVGYLGSITAMPLYTHTSAETKILLDN
jgi:hypothetical protein